MTIPGIEVGAKLIERQRNVPRCVGAINHAPDAALARFGNGVLDRKEQGGGRGDVAEEQHAGALGHAADDGLGKLALRGKRQRDIDHHDLGTGAAGDVGPGLFEG